MLVKISVIHPIMNPAHNPEATHPKAFHYVQVIVTIEAPEPEVNVKVDGSMKMSGMIAAVMRIVEIMSYHLTTPSTFSTETFWIWVAKKVVMNEQKIPIAVSIKGK